MKRASRRTVDESSWFGLDCRQGETLRAALQRELRERITEGAFRPGVRLPSSRALAQQLGVSRGVVTDAYAQLEAQGYLIVRPGSAPHVAALNAASASAPRPTPRSDQPPAVVLDATSPEVRHFPMRAWMNALGHASRTITADELDYSDLRGATALRDALSDHLGRTRGVVVAPDQIVVTQGYRQAMDLLLRVLAGRGANTVAVEDPCMTLLRRQVDAAGLVPVGVPVDDEGATTPPVDADATVVTPAHQFPTGVVLSGERRRALVSWAQTSDGLIVEDDYDAEFRYDREPIRAIQGLAPGHVAYIGTASKTFAPALRLGWLCLPDHLVDDVTRAKHLIDGGSPAMEQLALAHVLRSGEYDRHVRRSRVTYRTRRDVLTASLTRHFPGLEIAGVTAGLHVLLRLPHGTDDIAVRDAAHDAGIQCASLSQFAVSRTDLAGLVIGYGRIHEDAIDRAIAKLASVVGSARAD